MVSLCAVRCGSVRYGLGRQAWYCTVSPVEVRSVMVWQARQAPVRSGPIRSDVEWQARMVRRVMARWGDAWNGRIGAARQGVAWLVKAWLGRYCEVR